MYKTCTTSNADCFLHPHHFQHYTASGAAFKLKRLSRIKSIAAAFKLKAKQTIEDRDATMKHSGYLRMQTNASPVTVSGPSRAGTYGSVHAYAPFLFSFFCSFQVGPAVDVEVGGGEEEQYRRVHTPDNASVRKMSRSLRKMQSLDRGRVPQQESKSGPSISTLKTPLLPSGKPQ